MTLSSGISPHKKYVIAGSLVFLILGLHILGMYQRNSLMGKWCVEGYCIDGEYVSPEEIHCYYGEEFNAWNKFTLTFTSSQVFMHSPGLHGYDENVLSYETAKDSIIIHPLEGQHDYVLLRLKSAMLCWTYDGSILVFLKKA